MIEEDAAVVAGDDAPEDNAPPARDYETEARASGWVPETEWRGEKKPAAFLDAETFVKRGEELTPFIRKENKQLKQQLDETKADFAKRIERMEKATAKAFEAEKRNHEAELTRVKREQRAAAESGDVAEFDRLEAEKGKIEKNAPTGEDAPDEKLTPAQAQAKKQEKWVAENPWFEADFDVRDWAIRYSTWCGEKNPKLSFEENMKVVEAEARKRYPAVFKKPAANGHAAVDGGSDFSDVFGGKGKKSEADLPPEARQAGERYVKQGLYKNLGAYAKEYFNG